MQSATTAGGATQPSEYSSAVGDKCAVQGLRMRKVIMQKGNNKKEIMQEPAMLNDWQRRQQALFAC